MLDDIRSFLAIPHAVQELLSAELTPTISLVLPAYEKLIRLLKMASARYCLLSHAINISVIKMEEYFEKVRRNPVLTLAMSMCPVTPT